MAVACGLVAGADGAAAGSACRRGGGAGDPRRAITHIRDWLNTLFPSERLMGGQAFGKLSQQFTADLPQILKASRLTDAELTFVDWSGLITDWLNVNQQRRGK